MTSPARWRTTVPDPQVLAPDLVDVVERGVSYGRAAHEHRLDVRDRGQRPGPPDVDLDRLQPGRHLLGRELVGDRPARRAGDEPQPLLLGQRVHLDDHAIGLVLEVVALVLPLLDEGEDLVHALAPSRRAG